MVSPTKAAPRRYKWSFFFQYPSHLIGTDRQSAISRLTFVTNGVLSSAVHGAAFPYGRREKHWSRSFIDVARYPRYLLFRSCQPCTAINPWTWNWERRRIIGEERSFAVNVSNYCWHIFIAIFKTAPSAEAGTIFKTYRFNLRLILSAVNMNFIFLNNITRFTSSAKLLYSARIYHIYSLREAILILQIAPNSTRSIVPSAENGILSLRKAILPFSKIFMAPNVTSFYLTTRIVLCFNFHNWIISRER